MTFASYGVFSVKKSDFSGNRQKNSVSYCKSTTYFTLLTLSVVQDFCSKTRASVTVTALYNKFNAFIKNTSFSGVSL